jgi:hypothetical protein
MSVRWTNYHEIERLEREWGVPLPDEYKRVVALHQGMGPEPSVFNVGKSKNVFNSLLTVSEDPERRASSASYVFNLLKPHLKPGVFPFANTPGGELLCFDYRASSEQPGIVLVTVEMDIYPVADSFNDFLAGLHDA